MKNLKHQLIRLGHECPELRPHLTSVIASIEKTSDAHTYQEFDEFQEHVGKLRGKLNKAKKEMTRDEKREYGRQVDALDQKIMEIFQSVEHLLQDLSRGMP